ncbi:MAG TPA: AI-2E family transporter [Trichormus sp.]|jgi:predicted PurR-regulated permease PerM
MFKWLMVLLLLLFVYHVREVFPPFIVGAIIAYLLYPLVKFLNQRWHFRPFWSVLLIYFATGAVVGFIAWHFWPVLVDEATNLFEQRREIVTNLVDQVRQQFSLQIDVHETSDIILSQLQNSIGKPEEIVHFGGVVSKSLLSILVCAVTSVYMLADNKRVGRFFMRFVAPEKRATVVSLAGQMDVMFRKYVLGQLGLITLMSFIAFCILSCCGIKYALLIALVTGFLEIIPVLGPLLAIIIASVFAVAQLGISHFWIVPLWYWIARLLEDYVIVPNTIGHAVELHPLAVIFAVVVGETMAGALGMLIAIPVAASIKVVLDFCYPPTTMAVPIEHKSPLDKLFKNILPAKQVDPQVERLSADIETIGAMHEGAQGIAPHILIDKSTAEHNVLHMASGSINPIPGQLPEPLRVSPPEPAMAAHLMDAPTPTRQVDTFKQMASRVKGEATATDKSNQQPTHPLPVQQETLTGMAARIKTDKKAAEEAEKASATPAAKSETPAEVSDSNQAPETDPAHRSEGTGTPTTAQPGAAKPESAAAKSKSTTENSEPATTKSKSVAAKHESANESSESKKENSERAIKEESKSESEPSTRAQEKASESALSETTAESEATVAPAPAKEQAAESKKEMSTAKDSKKDQQRGS